MPTWTKKDGSVRTSIYQSYFNQKSPLVIRFTGDVMKSRDGDDHIVPFEVQGDPQAKPYWLLLENEGVEDEVRRAPQNAWLEVSTAGSREEAVLSWKPATGGNQTELPAPSAQKAQGRAQSAPDFTREPFPYPNLQAAYAIALDAALEFKGLVPEGEEVSATDAIQLAASMLHRQESLWKSTGKWVPLTAAEAKHNPAPTDGNGYATLEQAAELANLYAQLKNVIPNGPEKDGVLKVIGKREQASRGDVQKCVSYLKGWHAAIEARELERDFSDAALGPEDDLPF